MATYDFIQRLIELRKAEKKGTLAPAERDEIDEVKEKFAKAICTAQGLQIQPGQRARSSFRVAVIYRVEITLGRETEKTVTMDASVGGFSSLFTRAPAPTTEGSFVLFLSKTDSISGDLVVAGVRDRKRVSLAFKKLQPPQAVRLEDALFDAILPNFEKPQKK